MGPGSLAVPVTGRVELGILPLPGNVYLTCYLARYAYPHAVVGSGAPYEQPSTYSSGVSSPSADSPRDRSSGVKSRSALPAAAATGTRLR